MKGFYKKIINERRGGFGLFKQKIYLIFTFLLINLFFLSFSVVFANEKEDLINKQLIIFELKREILLINNELNEVEKSTQMIKKDILSQEKENEKIKERVKEMLVTVQKRGKYDFLHMVFASNDFFDFLRITELINVIFKRQNELINLYIAENEKLKNKKDLLDYEKNYLLELKEYHKKRLIDLGVSEKELNYELNQLEEGEEIRKLGEELIILWKNEGLETFELFFSALASTMNELPNHLSKDKIKSSGFLKREIAFKEEELNKIIKTNPLLKSINIKFKPDQLVVEGNYNNLSLLITGKYKITEEHNLSFEIERMFFNGYSLPQNTINEMNKKYDLGFYPNQIVKGAKILDFGINLNEIKMEIGF